jgi:hypothetical protein
MIPGGDCCRPALDAGFRGERLFGLYDAERLSITMSPSPAARVGTNPTVGRIVAAGRVAAVVGGASGATGRLGRMADGGG